MNQILRIGQEIEGFLVKEYCKTYGVNNAQSYKVADTKGNTFIMKIMVDDAVPLNLMRPFAV